MKTDTGCQPAKIDPSRAVFLPVSPPGGRCSREKERWKGSRITDFGDTDDRRLAQILLRYAYGNPNVPVEA